MLLSGMKGRLGLPLVIRTRYHSKICSQKEAHRLEEDQGQELEVPLNLLRRRFVAGAQVVVQEDRVS